MAKLVKVGPHWINPDHVVAVHPNDWEAGNGYKSEWTTIQMLPDYSIELDAEPDLTPDRVAELLNGD